MSTLITILDGAPLPAQVIFYGVTNAPTGATAPVLDSQGNLPIPGVVVPNQATGGGVGLNGQIQRVELLQTRTNVGGGVAAALGANTSTTNAAAYTQTSGSVSFLQSFQTGTTATTSFSFVNRLTISANYVGSGANLTLGVVAANTGGGSVSLCNINAFAYPLPGLGVTLGSNMTNGTAQTVASTSPTTYTWVMTGGGTAAPVLQPGKTPVILSVDFQQTNASGTNGLNIYDWFII